MRGIKDCLIKITNPTSPVDSTECNSQCEHVLRDTIQSLRDSNNIKERTTNDNVAVGHSVTPFSISYEDASNEISRHFDFELLNKNARRRRNYY